MKFIITIPKQSFIAEGENQEEATARFFSSDDLGNLDWSAEQVCDICECPEDEDGRCGCTNKDAN